MEQFFPAVDHAILRRQLATKINNTQVLWLIDQILDSGAGVLAEEYEMRWFAGDDLTAALRPRGLPIGNLTSQFWANCYLHDLDNFVKRGLACRAYLRYVDDILLFDNDKAQLWRWWAAIVERLARLRLTIHPAAQPRPVLEGMPFLGFVVYPDRRLKRRKGIHVRRWFKRLISVYEAGEIPLETVLASVQGWVNHVRYGNTVGLRKAALNIPIRGLCLSRQESVSSSGPVEVASPPGAVGVEALRH